MIINVLDYASKKKKNVGTALIYQMHYVKYLYNIHKKKNRRKKPKNM